jgi:HEAT repeat protein
MLVSVSTSCHPAGMGKKRGILLAVLFVALLGGLIWMLSDPTEPVCQGKLLSVWLNEINTNGWPRTNDPAVAAFREMGANAIPALVNALRPGDPPFFQRLLLEVNRRQSLLQFPVRKTRDQRWAASSALYALGANAKPAYPALTNLLCHTNTVIYSAVALAGMGPEGLPPLLAALTNQNPFIRLCAATGLMWVRSDLDIVVPALIARLSDQDAMVHLRAVEALGRWHAEPGLAVPALMKDFPGKDPARRCAILRAIGQFEANASAAVPMLLETLSDNDQDVRNQAAWALMQIDSAAAPKDGAK